MSTNFASIEINTLSSFSFIAGTKQILNFDAMETNGSQIDLSTATCSVVFSPYGDYTYAAITVSGSVSGSLISRFTAILTGSSTQSLSGKYTMQPVIVDAGGNEFRPGQGVVLITGRNATI